MEKYTVKIYQKENYAQWNNFVATAKNATFLFHRDFMEYHQDRFQDFSLLVFDAKEKLAAILPANRVDNEVFSHQGLTYGGVVFTSKSYFTENLQVYKTILKFLNQNSIENLFYKEIPSFYNQYFADEMGYFIFRSNGKLLKKEVNSVLDLRNKILINPTRKNISNKNLNQKYQIVKSQNPTVFWNTILTPLLETKHNSRPTHSLAEIKKLLHLFSENIHLFEVWENNEIKGGSVIFTNKQVAHCQYIAKKTEKNNFALDFLFKNLIFDYFKDFNIFDFGISNENNGRNVNEGLIYWKESFGAKSVCQNFYQIETKNYHLLENILI